MGNSSGNTNSKGAAYFITNEPDNNFIVSADIGGDGRLTLRQAVATGGHGLHGGPTADPDPLFSQGAIKVSSANNMLATVNAGSNTISLFNIDQNDPAKLDRVGSPIGSGGEFPISVSFNKAGDRLCALNGGEVNSVSCFKVDNQNGLVPAAGTNRPLKLNQTTPANGPPGTASQLLFSEDEKQLVVSVKGVPPKPGFFAVWDVDQNGALSKDFRSVAPAKGGVLPFSMTIVPGANAILSTDPGVGFTIFDMSASSKDSTSVAAGKSSAVTIDGQKATCWSSFSPKTGNFYLTDIGTSNVVEVKVDKTTLKGSVVKQYNQGANSGTIDNNIASIGDKDFLYILSANATRLDVLSLDAPGQAKNIQKLDLAGPAKASELKITGSNLQGMATFIKK
ncbi:hypothetical protein L218DRAFT_854401 [Marasmius fiardii PR-910]|nr:hypothetical protein L218DRAFT_854401 [Marasmius fiardii PR-910]